MWVLTKCSSPSWEKSFTDIKELHKTLEGETFVGYENFETWAEAIEYAQGFGYED